MVYSVATCCPFQDLAVKNEIDAAALTTFEVTLDGSAVRLNVLDKAGEPASLLLPAECVNQFLMTIPRMVEAALRKTHGDDSLRFVHPIENFTLDLAGQEGDGEPHLILTLQTGGGFKASFGAGEEVMKELGHSIVNNIEPYPLAQRTSILRS
jgi:hypothetical protein